MFWVIRIYRIIFYWIEAASTPNLKLFHILKELHISFETKSVVRKIEKHILPQRRTPLLALQLALPPCITPDTSHPSNLQALGRWSPPSNPKFFPPSPTIWRRLHSAHLWTPTGPSPESCTPLQSGPFSASWEPGAVRSSTSIKIWLVSLCFLRVRSKRTRCKLSCLGQLSMI